METTTKNEIREIRWPGKTFVTVRTTLPFDKLTAFFSANYAAIYQAIAKLHVQSVEPPCAIYYSVDEAKKVTDLAAAIPVHGLAGEIEGFEKLVVPASKAVTVTHYGSYDSMSASYNQLEKYITEHGLKRKLILEEYLSDPAVEKDPANWKTNIYYIVE